MYNPIFAILSCFGVSQPRLVSALCKSMWTARIRTHLMNLRLCGGPILVIGTRPRGLSWVSGCRRRRAMEGETGDPIGGRAEELLNAFAPFCCVEAQADASYWNIICSRISEDRYVIYV